MPWRLWPKGPPSPPPPWKNGPLACFSSINSFIFMLKMDDSQAKAQKLPLACMRGCEPRLKSMPKSSNAVFDQRPGGMLNTIAQPPVPPGIFWGLSSFQMHYYLVANGLTPTALPVSDHRAWRPTPATYRACRKRKRCGLSVKRKNPPCRPSSSNPCETGWRPRGRRITAAGSAEAPETASRTRGETTDADGTTGNAR